MKISCPVIAVVLTSAARSAFAAIILVCSVGAPFQALAQGFIVPNGIATSPGNTITVIQNPSSGDFTGFVLQFQGTDNFLFSPFLDEGVRTFMVSANDLVSLRPITDNNYTELTYPHSYGFPNGSPFYLGFYTGYNPWDPQGHYTGIYMDPVFGWGQFVNNNGVIQLLDSALEYGGGGIYTGTQNIIPVPEPGALALTGVGALFIAPGWRRKRTS